MTQEYRDIYTTVDCQTCNKRKATLIAIDKEYMKGVMKKRYICESCKQDEMKEVKKDGGIPN